MIQTWPSRCIRLPCPVPEMIKIGESQKFRVRNQQKHASCSSRYPAQTIMASEHSFCPRYALLFSIVFTYHFFAWNNAYARTCERRVKFIASCISRQVDFIQGGGNLFAQRDFKKDAHSDFRSCILIDLLERFLGRINLNLNRSALNRITYNVVSSTQASEYIKAPNNTGADCDCMLCT